VSGFVLKDSVLSGLGNGPDEDGIHFYNMVGASSITNTLISGSGDDNVNIQNNNNLPADLPQSTTGTITITGGSANAGVQGSGYLFGIRGTMNTTINISGVTADNNFSGGVVADNFDTATMVLKLSTSQILNNNDGVQVSNNNGSARFNISGNTFLGQDFVNVNLLKAAFSTAGTLEGAIQNNSITVANGRPTDGIFLFNAGGGALTAAVTNNTIDYAGTQRALAAQAGQDGSGSLDLTMTGNNIDVKLDGNLDAAAGMLVQAAITSPTGDGASFCGDIGGAGALKNTFTHSLGGAMAAGDIRLRQRLNGTARLAGYAGAATDTAAVATYLGGRNTLVSTATATVNVTGFASGPCAVPNVP
jgi:hypothetical protein